MGLRRRCLSGLWVTWWCRLGVLRLGLLLWLLAWMVTVVLRLVRMADLIVVWLCVTGGVWFRSCRCLWLVRRLKGLGLREVWLLIGLVRGLR